jgi:hypothetical protein
MRFALINPPWTFDGSIYFGCREPHLPLEFGYSKALLEAAGHEALLIDGQLDRLSQAEIVGQIQAFRPDFTVITTAPQLSLLALPSARNPGAFGVGESVKRHGQTGDCRTSWLNHAASSPEEVKRRFCGTR